ncbi:MAG: response regulator, partial [Desulfobacteraceae bacterium]
ANCRDRGACFTFHACLEPATSEEALSKEKPDRFIGIEPGAKRNRVLVADDDTTSRMLLSEILASVGLDVEKAENGEEAVELFSQWRPDIVFMDVRMPKMDGLAATQRIKATDRGRHTPVIALTAHAFEEDRQEILSAGCDDYLRKPIDEQQLFELVGRILDITFIRENSAPQETPALKGAAALLNAMSELPAPLLTELREIALELDLEKVKSCLDQIETSHPALGAALFKLSNEFRFEEIYNLCDGALKAKV